MKKLVIAVIALLVVAAAGASAAYVVKPDTINTVFQSYNDTNWTTSWDRSSNGAVVIDETANVDGHAYRVTIEGSDDSVYRVSLDGWYEDMKMLDDGQFSEGLHIYNDLSATCADFLPDGDAIYYIFSAYDIYYAVREGSGYFDEDTIDGWELVPTQPGRLIMRRGSCMVEAQRAADGRFLFTVTF